jgi:uncharacterized protein (DUF697 family)
MQESSPHTVEEPITTEAQNTVSEQETHSHQDTMTEQAADTNQEAEIQDSTPSTSHYDKAQIIVKNYTLSSLTAAVVPIPLVDLGILTSMQLKMLYDLSCLYEVEFSPKIANAAIAPLITSVLPIVTTPLLASIVKFIPGVGQISGVATMLVLSGAATHALGMVFIRHFEQGGDFTNFDAQIVKQYFSEEFEKGKQVATELKQKSQDKITELKVGLS